jgi:hypothetical protein
LSNKHETEYGKNFETLSETTTRVETSLDTIMVKFNLNKAELVQNFSALKESQQISEGILEESVKLLYDI